MSPGGRFPSADLPHDVDGLLQIGLRVDLGYRAEPEPEDRGGGIEPELPADPGAAVLPSWLELHEVTFAASQARWTTRSKAFFVCCSRGTRFDSDFRTLTSWLGWRRVFRLAARSARTASTASRG